MVEARKHSVAWKIRRHGLTKVPTGKTMKGKDHKAPGRGGTAPLPGQSSLTLPIFERARNNRVAMHEVLRVCPTTNSRSRTRNNRSLTVFGSLDFQTCRIADSPKSAGREAALEVGLETRAATVRRGDLTYNSSLSFVASCHR